MSTGADRRWDTAALAVAVVLTAVVVLAVVGTDRIPARPPVVVIGDSITAMSATELHDRLGAETALSVDGRSGYTVAAQMLAAERLAGRGPEQVIVNLGTNDVNRGLDLQAAAEDMRVLLANFPRARCIHLVTVNEAMESPRPEVDSPERARELNRYYRDIAAADPRIRILDWAEIVREGDRTGTVLTEGTIHPTPEGRRVLAEAYAEALSTCRAP